MLKNYFKIAWRNIMKHKVFSLINIIGLTIGLSASFVIGLMIYYDTTFDNFHEDGNRIYRVVTDYRSPEGEFYNSGITLALEDAIKENTNIETLSSFYIERPAKVENKALDSEFKWPNFVIFTDANYFDIFKYTFLAGNNADALSNPNQVILTEKRAAVYFPNTTPADVLGKTLVYNDSLTIEVAGVVENLKGRTDFVFEEFISSPTLLQTRLREQFLEKNWNNTNSNSQLYVKLEKQASLDILQQRLNALAMEHQDEESKKYQEERKFRLQPLQDIHFNENYGTYDWASGQASKSLLTNLALIALFLLLLGCINFINLNTAQASQRAKEIGIRKTLGSSRKQLIIQFMGETFLLVLLSALLSFALTKWLLIIFSDFVPEGLGFELFKSPWVIIGSLFLVLVVTLLSGFYPALVLSKLNTVYVLKNNFGTGEKKASLRKFLTIFQFTIAQVFIISTLLVSMQIDYLITKDMGFKTNAIVSVFSPRGERELSKKKLFAEKLTTIPEIKSISIGGMPPASISTSISGAVYMDGEQEIYSELQFIYGDTHYLDLFEIKLLAGRSHRNDTIRELVINETYLNTLGFQIPHEALGKLINIDEQEIPIVGVMADFHQRSLRNDIRPMALRGDWYRPNWSQFQAIHISFQNETSKDIKETLSKIENTYQSVYTELEDYRLEFLDESIQKFYHREQKTAKLLNWATALSVIISCLGLLGLVIYTTNRRIKEIGVRKVLGASVFQINYLLCKEFLFLVAIAFIIASPIAWYGMNSWLRDFTYKINISFWIFLASGFVMIFFALLVISIKTLQAASRNPVKSLKTE